MKLKNTLLASVLLSVTALSANAATELTPEQAAALKPFDQTVIVGRYNTISEAVAAASKLADKVGAASFYVVDSSDHGNSGNQRVTVALYKQDAGSGCPSLRIPEPVRRSPVSTRCGPGIKAVEILCSRSGAAFLY